MTLGREHLWVESIFDFRFFRDPGSGASSGQPPPPRPRRLAWAELLKRTFAVDVLRCVHCGGRRELLAVVMKPEAVAAILTHLGLDTDDAGPRPPPSQLDLI